MNQIITNLQKIQVEQNQGLNQSQINNQGNQTRGLNEQNMNPENQLEKQQIKIKPNQQPSQQQDQQQL